MISIPLYIFLFIYFFFLITFAAFFLINMSHLVRTGTLTLASLSATLAFLVFSAFILVATFYFLHGFDWQQPVILWNNQWFGSVFSSDFVSP